MVIEQKSLKLIISLQVNLKSFSLTFNGDFHWVVRNSACVFLTPKNFLDEIHILVFLLYTYNQSLYDVLIYEVLWLSIQVGVGVLTLTHCLTLYIG